MSVNQDGTGITLSYVHSTYIYTYLQTMRLLMLKWTWLKYRKQKEKKNQKRLSYDVGVYSVRGHLSNVFMQQLWMGGNAT